MITERNIQGTKKMVKGGIGAFTGFTSKITGSISNYLTLATQDKE